MPSTGFFKAVAGEVISGFTQNQVEAMASNQSGQILDMPANSEVKLQFKPSQPVFIDGGIGQSSLLPDNAIITGFTVSYKVGTTNNGGGSTIEFSIESFNNVIGGTISDSFTHDAEAKKAGVNPTDQALSGTFMENINVITAANGFSTPTVNTAGIFLNIKVTNDSGGVDLTDFFLDTTSPSIALNIHYERVTSSVKITNSTKVLLKGVNPNISQDSLERGAVTLLNNSGVTDANSLLNGVGSNASFSPNGFATLGDFFTSANPLGEFIIPENASNIQLTIRATGLNANIEGDVRLKYSFISSAQSEAITIVGDPGVYVGSGISRAHTDVLTHSGFTPSFWNNFQSITIQLNDDYPLTTNYVIIGFIDQVDPSLQLTFDMTSVKTTIS